ncbi:hypothetical protein [Kluyvera intermedia]|uniref:hypothetical protein n=1 Tax=Kluyvera intermedia TaxID=61648 RepID=UPI00372D3112
MTDITAQAQRMKAAALKAKSEANEWGYDTDAFHDEANPDAVIQVVEDLEASRAENKLWALEMTKRNGEIYGLEQRIAELESSTVTLEPFRSFVTNDDIAALHRFAECCDDPESGGHDLEREQVRRLEAIGALQRSGRVSYITGFGDVLISITAGIQVIEGEGKLGKLVKSTKQYQ